MQRWLKLQKTDLGAALLGQHSSCQRSTRRVCFSKGTPYDYASYASKVVLRLSVSELSLDFAPTGGREQSPVTSRHVIIFPLVCGQSLPCRRRASQRVVGLRDIPCRVDLKRESLSKSGSPNLVALIAGTTRSSAVNGLNFPCDESFTPDGLECLSWDPAKVLSNLDALGFSRMHCNAIRDSGLMPRPIERHD